MMNDILDSVTGEGLLHSFRALDDFGCYVRTKAALQSGEIPFFLEQQQLSL